MTLPRSVLVSVAVGFGALAACSGGAPTSGTEILPPDGISPVEQDGASAVADSGAGDAPTGSSSCTPTCTSTQVCSAGNCLELPATCPCPSGSYCDLSTNKCQVGCLAEGDCAKGEFCNAARQCRTGCNVDTQCASGSYCDLPSSTCKPGCRDDAGCGPNRKCTSHVCACEGGFLDCAGVCAKCPSEGTPTCCGNACVAKDRDPLNCGTCGNNCQTWGAAHGVSAASAYCVASQCGATVPSNGEQKSCATTCAAAGLTCTAMAGPPVGSFLANYCNGACVGFEQYVYAINGMCVDIHQLKTCNEVAPAAITCNFPGGVTKPGSALRSTCLCR